ncbi:MAG: corrinoid protein [Desulfobacterales bacterium]|jgi:5-methyltetrahydrofolate--homocysteine methyltransferase
MKILQQIYQSILNGRADDCKACAQQALVENILPQEIVAKGMNSAMEEIGLRFSRNEIFLPEMMVAARAMNSGMAVLEPHIVKESQTGVGKMVLGTVKGDLHDVGKNLVAMMFKGAGFDVVDLGIDVPKEKFLESIQQQSPQLLGISALLSTTLPNVVETIAFLRDSGVDGNCKILVGGAPVTEKFANDAKADGYAADAGSAIQLAKKMLAK